ncbi:uncharacterized protein PG986_002156 [Apiospora aurea]|uniref:Uncharacterized protein n=1 Tax=Apiospora aurea TaxID=335848 RepID=A0ABR1QZ31_9PEZI
MTSVQSFGGLRSFRSSEKMHKPRSSKVVKPILKKLSSTSEKSSLDLDRSWDEQDEAFRYQNSAGVWDGGVEGAFCSSPGINRASSTKDVSFALGTDPVGRTSTSGTRFSSTHHSRSISGTSVATSGSGSGGAAGVVGAGGSSSVAPRSFVHPFQQIPRTATPPISYANSLASSYVDSRDYSPTITEDEDYSATNYDLADPTTSRISLHHSNNHHSSSLTNVQYRQQQLLQQIPTDNLNTRSQPSLTSSPSLNSRRPTLTTHRTTSYSEGPRSHPSSLRINTTAARSMSTTTPVQSSRLANVSSQTDLTTVEVSTSGSSPSHPPLQKFASPSSTVSSSISPVMRSSFEAVNFPRLRAKSDLDTATRQDHLREARRKFEAREQAKEEKWAREQIRRREREDNKRALEVEKQAKAQRKEREAAKLRLEAAEMAEAALPHNKQHNRKSSGNSTGRPNMTRMRSGRTNTGGSLSSSSSSNSSPNSSSSRPRTQRSSRRATTRRAGTARTASYETPRRSHTAKRKTHGAWTAFILWLRTRLLRLKKGKSQ